MKHDLLMLKPHLQENFWPHTIFAFLCQNQFWKIRKHFGCSILQRFELEYYFKTSVMPKVWPFNTKFKTKKKTNFSRIFFFFWNTFLKPFLSKLSKFMLFFCCFWQSLLFIFLYKTMLLFLFSIRKHAYLQLVVLLSLEKTIYSEFLWGPQNC